MYISNAVAGQFFLLFKGKTTSYVRNELPKVRPEGGKFKTKITTVRDRLTKDVITRHLEGDFAVGLCPISNDNKVYLACLDIDCYDGRLGKVLGFIREYNLPLIPFRSKSGGLHLYVFFSKAVSAKSARDTLRRIVYSFSLDEIYGKGKVEIFPKQENLDEGSCGSCLTLPYFNAEEAYTYMLNYDGEEQSLAECLAFIPKHMTTLESIKETLESLPFSDAPPCLQKGLIASLVGDEDSGRNNFLFSFAVYAKKKYGTGFETYVQEANGRFKAPLEDSVVDQICSSVSNNEYYYRCKDIPCSGLCDKTVCKSRMYGLGMGGKDKGKFTGIEYGELRRYKTADPYYEWDLRIHGQEQWRKCVFRDESYLLDQKNFQKACVRYLNVAPYTVSSNDWYAILNSVLPNIVDIEVKVEADTSGTNMLRSAFINYLSNKQARRDSPYQIKVGLCVRQERNGEAKYYFTHRGFTDYLKNQKIAFDYALLRETLKGFGAVEDVLYYTNALNEAVSFPCWSKKEDSEMLDAYNSAVEVDQGDKANMGVLGVSEVVNTADASETEAHEKPYTEEDMEEAKKLF